MWTAFRDPKRRAYASRTTKLYVGADFGTCGVWLPVAVRNASSTLRWSLRLGDQCKHSNFGPKVAREQRSYVSFPFHATSILTCSQVLSELSYRNGGREVIAFLHSSLSEARDAFCRVPNYHASIDTPNSPLSACDASTVMLSDTLLLNVAVGARPSKSSRARCGFLPLKPHDRFLSCSCHYLEEIVRSRTQSAYSLDYLQSTPIPRPR